MQVNDKKTKFMVIYVTDDNKCPIAINEHKIEHCDKYIYLGGWPTEDGCIKNVLGQESQTADTVSNKYAIYIASNSSAQPLSGWPFH